MHLRRGTSRILLSLAVGTVAVCLLAIILSREPGVVESAMPDHRTVESVTIQKQSSEEEIFFQLAVPPPVIDQEGNVFVEGLSQVTDQPGQPQLPYYSTMIVVPPVGQYSITVRSQNSSVSIKPQVAQSPRAQIAPLLPENNVIVSPGYSLANRLLDTDQTSDYDAYYPDNLYEISKPMFVRDLRLIRLNLYPLRYNGHSHELIHVGEIQVTVQFDGADNGSINVLPDKQGRTLDGLGNQIINLDQAGTWRGLPAGLAAPEAPFPIGTDVFKIEVVEDGIYELSAQQLATAGMATGQGGVDPHTLQMMYRGETIAYQFLGDDDKIFEEGETIRFYGWAFDGSRLERQFINENVYWLWADGDPVLIESTTSVSGTSISQIPYSITVEQENRWFPSYTNQWHQFPNEPDAWYWHLFRTSFTPVTGTFEIDLAYPVENGSPAVVTAEFSSRGTFYHEASISVNDSGYPGPFSWYGHQNLNITRTISPTELQHGLNTIEITASSQTPFPGFNIALNRITIDYQRHLTAVDNRIIFTDEGGDPRQFNIDGYDNSEVSKMVVWDISERTAPIRLTTETMSIYGTGPYSFSFGTASPNPRTFVATVSVALFEPESVSKYSPINLDPLAGSGADWVAIAYSDFLTETHRLATHRSSSQFGNLKAHVVDIEDVVNQYGYGLPIPEAIRSYMLHALLQWDRPPTYLLLVGDSTIDPRHHRDDWPDLQYVPTDLVFEDFWQGQIPSDHSYSLLVGDDILPDIAVGRFAVQTENDLASIINKIIQYEEIHLLPLGWMENIVFVADADDPDAGFFCSESMDTASQLAMSFQSAYLCRDDYDSSADLFEDILLSANNSGTSIINYRGHGSVQYWGQGEIIMSSNDMDRWNNPNRSFLSISGDCLDGHFALPNSPGLGEALLRAVDPTGNSVGAVGHWGSSGLGTSNNHSHLINAFYEALFVGGQVAVGDTTMSAKIDYGLASYTDPTLLWSFILLGDPAMQLFRRSLSIEQAVDKPIASVGDTISFTIQVVNNGVYPSDTTISHTLLPGFELNSVSSTISLSHEVIGDTILFDLQFGNEEQDKGIPRGATVQLTVVYEILPEVALGKNFFHAMTTGTGLEAWPGDESASVEITIVAPSTYTPFIIH